MKAKHVERTAMLVRAQEGLAALERAARKTKVDPRGGDYRAMSIDVGDYCADGGSPDAGIELDRETGLKLIPALRKLITDELSAIGVRP